MQPFRPSAPRAGLGFRARQLAHGGLPLAVWLGAVAGVVALGLSLPPAARIQGIVEVTHATVRAPADGRIAALLVGMHEEVQAGQVVARMDDTALRLQLAELAAEIEMHRAELAGSRSELDRVAAEAATRHQLDAAVEHRRLASALEDARLAALATRTDLEETRIRLSGAATEAQRTEAMVQQGILGEPELVRLRTERDALQRRVAELEQLQAGELARIEAARLRLERYAPGSPPAAAHEDALAPLRWQVQAKEALLDQVAHQVDLLELRAPIAGRIAPLSELARPRSAEDGLRPTAGEWVQAGTLLLTVVDPRPARILAYVPESAVGSLQPAQLLIVRRADGTELGTSLVRSVSPTAVPLPERLWRDPRQEEWGHELVLAATGNERPGERLHLSPAR
ncbi:MAG: hypothetical protein RL148_2503 [Planctomycetota bacterium]|jgi:HlyD family secretion protein